MFNKLSTFYHAYPWIVWTYLTIIIILDLIVIGYYFFKKEQFKDQIKEKSWLKISLYILAALNFFLIIFAVIYLLAGLGGGSRSTKRGRRGYKRRGRRRRIIRYG